MNAKLKANDIAIITLKKPIDLSSKSSVARPVCLPDKSDTKFVPGKTKFTATSTEKSIFPTVFVII